MSSCLLICISWNYGNPETWNDDLHGLHVIAINGIILLRDQFPIRSKNKMNCLWSWECECKYLPGWEQIKRIGDGDEVFNYLAVVRINCNSKLDGNGRSGCDHFQGWSASNPRPDYRGGLTRLKTPASKGSLVSHGKLNRISALTCA